MNDQNDIPAVLGSRDAWDSQDAWDYFAGQALAGLLSNPGGNTYATECVERACTVADMMMFRRDSKRRRRS